MAYTKILKYETLRSIASSTITGTYAALGTPLLNASSILKIANNSTQDVTVSVDGTNDCEYVPANSYVLYDFTSNTPSHGDDAIFIPQGTQFYVKGTAGTGNIYLTTLYIVQV